MSSDGRARQAAGHESAPALIRVESERKDGAEQETQRPAGGYHYATVRPDLPLRWDGGVDYPKRVLLARAREHQGLHFVLHQVVHDALELDDVRLDDLIVEVIDISVGLVESVLAQQIVSES